MAVDNNILVKGLRSRFPDFEDAMQIFAATAVARIECIVTRNTRGFKGAQLPVFALDELVGRL